MEKCFALVTLLGQAMLAAAIRENAPINLAEVAVGDSNYTPTEGQTALMNEKARFTINEITYDQDNPCWLRVTAVIPPGIGGWNIHEGGIYADNGNLFAIAKFDGTYKPLYSDGMVKEIALDFILEITTIANVNLTVDPHVILATRKWVEEYFGAKIGSLNTLMTNHIKDKNNPHQVSAEQVDSYTKSEVDAKITTTDGKITAHIGNKSNPHSVNAGQVGSYTKAEVDAMIKQAVAQADPPGSIKLWYGSAETIPAGYVLCDGQNSTPDLRGRVALGANTTYPAKSTGGEASHAHGLSGSVAGTALTINQIPAHSHANKGGDPGTNGQEPKNYAPVLIPNGSTTTGSAGGGQAHTHGATGLVAGSASSLPPYCALHYIMRKLS